MSAVYNNLFVFTKFGFEFIGHDVRQFIEIILSLNRFYSKLNVHRLSQIFLSDFDFEIFKVFGIFLLIIHM